MKNNKIKGTNQEVVQNKEPKTHTNRVMVFTPCTGSVRIEWVQARYSQIIPTNWSNLLFTQWFNSYMPLEFQLADAQNLMAKKVVEENIEWVVYIEHDNVIPVETFKIFNEYIIEGKTPVVSGLYFTKSEPGEPILYRGRGNGYYNNWKMGDKVWVDGIPFGCRLEHASLIKEAWKNSPEYQVGGQITRRVFDDTEKMYYDEDKGGIVAEKGTTDLAWCTRIMKDGLFKKDWPEYAKKQYPFLVDTNIFVKHITPDGTQYPLQVPAKYLKKT